VAKNETLYVSGSSSAHHQEFMNCALKSAYEQGRNSIPALLVSWLQTVWHLPVPSVQLMNSWWWAEELPETCRGSFLAKINLGNWCVCWLY